MQFQSASVRVTGGVETQRQERAACLRGTPQLSVCIVDRSVSCGRRLYGVMSRRARRFAATSGLEGVQRGMASGELSVGSRVGVGGEMEMGVRTARVYNARLKSCRS